MRGIKKCFTEITKRPPYFICFNTPRLYLVGDSSEKYGKEFVDHGPRRAFWYIGENSDGVGSKIVQAQKSSSEKKFILL